MFPYFLTHLKAKDDAGNQQAKENSVNQKDCYL